MTSGMTFFRNWRGGLLPGLSLIGVMVAIRLLGLLQVLEWKALDFALRSRPAEPVDNHVTIVTITEPDIQALDEYPISDGALAALLETLQTYNPRVIGLDIFRDIEIGSGNQRLTQVLANSENIIGIKKTGEPAIAPPLHCHQNGLALRMRCRIPMVF